MAKLDNRLIMLLKLNDLVSFEEFRKINKLDIEEKVEEDNTSKDEA
mgnify:CR=1 FL=1